MTIAFFYLLRVGEYTKPRMATQNGERVKATRTVQFRIQDIGFFNGNYSVKATGSNLDELLACSSATLRISNQKNGRMGDTIHQEALTKGQAHCPIRALARRVHHILSHGGTQDSLICAYKDNNNKWDHISAQTMVHTVRYHVSMHNLSHPHIDLGIVGAHSLRAGGAMALKLNGANDTTIMKMGRWSGLTFLMYIHTQIGNLSRGITTQMDTEIPFVNIAHF